MSAEKSNREKALGILDDNLKGTDGSLEGQSLSCRVAMVYAILALADAVEKLGPGSSVKVDTYEISGDWKPPVGPTT